MSVLDTAPLAPSGDGFVTWIDRTTCRREVPMKVLCLGPGRTGTDSMRVALKMLGFEDTYHGYSLVMENPPDAALWNKAMDAKFEGKGKFDREDWDQLLGNCMAVTDLPCVLFGEELIQTYPDAKVILTHPPKGFDRWYQSCINTIVALKDDWRRDAWAAVNNEARITREAFFRSFDHFWRDDFKKNARTVYDENNALVRSLVPSENLLEYDVTQGWGPLCKFLDVPVPDKDFPSGNDPQNFFNRFSVVDRRRRMETYETVGGILSSLVLAAAVGFRYRAAIWSLLDWH